MFDFHCFARFERQCGQIPHQSAYRGARDRGGQTLQLYAQLLAKGLRTNRTDTIGLLIPNIENSFFAGVAGVVIRESRNYNYKVVVVDTQEDERNEQDGLSALLARRVDGIVAAPCGSNSELFASVQEGGMPLVLLDR